jgi:hypothetical protein
MTPGRGRAAESLPGNVQSGGHEQDGADMTIVGVPNASISRMVPGVRDSATSVITTNCRPVSAAAEEPTMT